MLWRRLSSSWITLKPKPPFWKREHHADGQAHWVEAKISDADAQTLLGVIAMKVAGLILAGV